MNKINKILFVPGKNPKPPAPLHRALLWRCLLRGVEQVDPAVARDMAAQPECFQLAAWNALYYGASRPADPDLPWIEALVTKAGPAPQDIRQARSWRRRFAWLMYTAADLFPFLVVLVPDPAVKATIHETERYFANDGGVAEAIRERVQAPLRQAFERGERMLVIGHSMGSVIAYDALWELDRVQRRAGAIELFLTLGSPLGMRFVQRRLMGAHRSGPQRYPGNIKRWKNIAAVGDLTALDRRLRDDFAPMLDLGLVAAIEDQLGIYNYFRNEMGLNVHRSYGYLVNPMVGRALADWWRGADRIS